ncbi:UNVERIFIED_CONTAM: hypothetical protein GTU68_066083 [Idotea baltica]|nr:hypothetical protein [Idotea baltica]
MTAAEYLEWERRQDQKHEFLDGEVFLQAGGTRRHSLISSNISGELRTRLKNVDCESLNSDMRVLVEATGLHAYPDASVVCPPIEGDSDDVITNPVLIAEVLSPSKADFDRGGKFGHYRQIPSLRDYLVIYQDTARVEHHRRTVDNDWLLHEVFGTEHVLELPSLKISLPLTEIYAKVDFDE